MLQSLKAVQGYAIRTAQGDVGRIEDFYFDDKTLAVRFVVVKIGGGLAGRKVLLEPLALGVVNPQARALTTALTRDAVLAAPRSDTHIPVSRQREMEMAHVAWREAATEAVYIPGFGAVAALSMEDEAARVVAAENGAEDASSLTPFDAMLRRTESDDPHLRSMREVVGYEVQVLDEPDRGRNAGGRIVDFLADENTWRIAHIKVRTGSWWRRRDICLPAGLIAQVHWEAELVLLALPTALAPDGGIPDRAPSQWAMS